MHKIGEKIRHNFRTLFGNSIVGNSIDVDSIDVDKTNMDNDDDLDSQTET